LIIDDQGYLLNSTSSRLLLQHELPLFSDPINTKSKGASIRIVIPAKAGIQYFKNFWMPDQVRHDGKRCLLEGLELVE
jgi:hypothetical protein